MGFDDIPTENFARSDHYGVEVFICKREQNTPPLKHKNGIVAFQRLSGGENLRQHETSHQTNHTKNGGPIYVPMVELGVSGVVSFLFAESKANRKTVIGDNVYELMGLFLRTVGETRD